MQLCNWYQFLKEGNDMGSRSGRARRLEGGSEGWGSRAAPWITRTIF